MPPKLIEPCIKAGCPPRGLVLDPFGGSGTVGMVAESLGLDWLMFDLDHRNEALMRQRTAQPSLLGLITQ
jgi:DNA modification methylase